MFRVSNNFIGFLNIITLVISVPIISFGVWLAVHAASECERFLHQPILNLGIFLLVVSLLGLLGACCRMSLFLWMYLVVMFLLIMWMMCFLVFAYAVTNKAVGQALSEQGYKEYRLNEFSIWLQKKVEIPRTWTRIESCLKDAKVCGGFNRQHGIINATEFYKRTLSPIQAGCCKPPTECEFVFQNVTYWTAPTSGLVATNTDCKAWSNDQTMLCYSCSSCKAGVLSNVNNEWKSIAMFNLLLLVFLVVVYGAGCCAIRNNRKDKCYMRHGGVIL